MLASRRSKHRITARVDKPKIQIKHAGNTAILMKITRLLFAAGIAGAIALAANAQSIPDIGGISNADSGGNSDGDLILGFTNSSVTSELLVDVGPASDYYSTTNALASENTTQSGGALTPGTTYTVGAYVPATFTGVFGSNAYTSTTYWGVVGGNGAGGGPGSEAIKTLWLTSAGSALSSVAQSTQSHLSNSIDGMTQNASGQTPVGGGSSDAVTEAKGNSTSFTFLAGSAQDFNFSEGAILGNTAAAGSGSTTLELYELQPTDAHTGAATVDLGTFTLSSTGLTFTSYQAIPEPSTYAAILGACAIGFALLRRRSQSAAMGELV